MKIRLRDIAERTGYSVNTVSHALRDLPDISAATKEKIRRAAEEMDYIPDLRAGSFKSGKRRVVSVILPDIVNPHFTLLFHEAEAYFQRLGITSFFMNTGESPEEEENTVRASIGQDVDGVLLCPAVGGRAVALLERAGIPYVLVGRHLGEAHDAVITNDEEGGYLATQHLLSLGHRRVACVRIDGQISSDRERYAGYLRAHREAGLAPDSAMMLHLSPRARENTATIRNFLTQNPDCHAIFAFSDVLAEEILATAIGMGYRIPRDLSVVGFDRIEDACPQALPLTTVGTEGEGLGLAAARLLHERIEGSDDGKKRQISLAVQLKVGSSSGEFAKASF